MKIRNETKIWVLNLHVRNFTSHRSLNWIVFAHINMKYSKSPRIRTYFFESQAEIGSYFKGTKANFQGIEVLIEGCVL